MLFGVNSNVLSLIQQTNKSWIPNTDIKNTLSKGIFIKSGGAKRIRTDDPLLAKQVLYQLSYSPTFSGLLVVHFVTFYSNWCLAINAFCMKLI
jgi:hypothetical protein